MALENSKETSNEITIEEIQELDKDSYLIVDIRDEVEISHGAIPGAMAVQTDKLMPENLAETASEIFPVEKYMPGDNSKGKKLIICCTHGTNSIPLGGETYGAGIRCGEPQRQDIYHGCSTPWASRNRLIYVPTLRRASARSSTRRYGATSQRPSTDMSW